MKETAGDMTAADRARSTKKGEPKKTEARKELDKRATAKRWAQEIRRKDKMARMSGRGTLTRPGVHEEHGAGEFGTDKPVERFAKETPGQEVSRMNKPKYKKDMTTIGPKGKSTNEESKVTIVKTIKPRPMRKGSKAEAQAMMLKKQYDDLLKKYDGKPAALVPHKDFMEIEKLGKILRKAGVKMDESKDTDARMYRNMKKVQQDRKDAAKAEKKRKVVHSALRKTREIRKQMRNEDVIVQEGGLGKASQRTKPAKELNISRTEKKYLSGRSLKPEKRAAHKAERSKAKNDIKINPELETEEVTLATESVEIDPKLYYAVFDSYDQVIHGPYKSEKKAMDDMGGDVDEILRGDKLEAALRKGKYKKFRLNFKEEVNPTLDRAKEAVKRAAQRALYARQKLAKARVKTLAARRRRMGTDKAGR